MPLFVPAVIIGANAVGIVAGAVSAAQGAGKIRRGRRIAEDAETHHFASREHIAGLRSGVQERMDEYANQRAASSTRVLERMVEYLRANDRLAEVAGITPLSEVPIEPEALESIEHVVDVKRAASTVLLAGQVATASPAALSQVAVQVGTASTGTAIKSLSGAAGKRAMLAWLGGGAKAAGGGGMALGSVMGPLTAVGTGVTVLGLGVNIAGERFLTSATARATALDIVSEELLLWEAWLHGVRARTDELSATLARVTVDAEQSLAELEQVPLDHPDSEALFVHTLQLTSAVSELIRTPVLEDESPESEQHPTAREAEEV